MNRHSFRLILALKKLSGSPEDIQELFFSGKTELTNYTYGGFDEEDNLVYEEKIDTKSLAEDLYKDLFCQEKITVLSFDEAVQFVRQCFFSSRPKYSDFLEESFNPDYVCVDFDQYFKAEKEAAEALVQNLMAENEECFLVYVDFYEMKINNDSTLLYNRVLENAPHLVLDNGQFVTEN